MGYEDVIVKMRAGWICMMMMELKWWWDGMDETVLEAPGGGKGSHVLTPGGPGMTQGR